MRVCFLQHSGYGCIPAPPKLRLRGVVLHAQGPPEQRDDVAIRALRRRACKWESIGPEALAGASLHFSGTGPRANFCFPCCGPVQHLVYSSMIRQHADRMLVWVRLLRGDSQTHLLSCPTLRHWADLHTYTAPLAAASSAGQLLRTLRLPAPHCARTVMLFDTALRGRGSASAWEPLRSAVAVCVSLERFEFQGRRVPCSCAVSSAPGCASRASRLVRPVVFIAFAVSVTFRAVVACTAPVGRVSRCIGAIAWLGSARGMACS